MAVNEDYRALVRGISSVNFSGDPIPCKLLLTGDSAFPVWASPEKHVLIAASKYGKGRVVVLSHEAYLNLPQMMDFLKNAISWLKPSPEATIGVNNLGHLEQTLSASGHKVEKVSGVKKDLGVLCMNGYNDSQAKEIVSFIKEGGGLLIGGQAWHWAQSHQQDNVLQCNFPGNKITSVSGIYFTSQVGEKGNFNVSEKIPWCPFCKGVSFSADLKRLMQGVSNVDISGGCVPSELLLHGPLTFPIGLSNGNQCFLAAAYYGRGRVVVATHEGYVRNPNLKTFWLNAVSWLDMGRQGKIGVKDLSNFANIIKPEGFDSVVCNLVPDLSVYCCTSYSDAEAEKIQQFVAEGGGLLIAGHAWYWSYSHPNVLSQYPGNKILNKLGISILGATVPGGNYPALDPQAEATTYHFPRAICQLLSDFKTGAELNPPLSQWLSKLRQDVSTFMGLPASPLISSLQEELVQLVHSSAMPTVSKQNPAKNCSKEAFMMCLAQEVTYMDKLQCDCGPCIPPVTVEIDATNPGPDAWRSLGLYLPPRKTATLVFPASAVGKGLQVQVGCHSDNLSGANEYCRAPVVVHTRGVVQEKVSISCVWGGLLYVIVKGQSQLGNVQISVQGVELAPMFIKGKTSQSSWVQTIRNHPAPWAELLTENIILTVPSDVIRSLDDPDALMSQWDKIMEAIADLGSTPKKFARPERFVTDVQISAGWMHAGYPIMCHLPTATELVNLENMKNGMWGSIHELGHNQQRGTWEFPPHTTEATCNLWSVYVHETVLGIPRDKAHPNLKPDSRENRVKQYLNNGAKLNEWSIWTALETYLQLQEGFGWESYKQVFKEYQSMKNVSNNNNGKMNLWAETFSQAVNKNLVPFFKAWGWPIDDATDQKLSTLPEWDKDPMKSYVSSK